MSVVMLGTCMKIVDGPTVVVKWSLPCRRTRGLDLWSMMLAKALVDSPLAGVTRARPWRTENNTQCA